jgi:hephaestin
MRVAATRSVIASVVVLVLAGCSAAQSATSSPGSAAAKASVGGATVRVHYIAADPVEWDYAPTGKNLVTGEALGDAEATWTERGPDRIGHVYRKSLYREYTDATFTKLAPRPRAWQHLGMLGPVIHAEVGDTLKVTFKNNTPWPASMHPHGVFYDKDSEGTPYDDGTSAKDKTDDAVEPGATHTYIWKVPERAGPGPMDGSSIMWMYHSHTDEVADTYSGLMGPIIVTRKGMARADGSPKDVERELVVNFMVENENNSLWLDDNIQTYAEDPASVNTDDDEFVESNLMHSINGYVFGNLPGLTIRKGEHVRWYLMGMGTEVDLHTPHWHGNTVLVSGMRSDVVSLLPASMVVADMTPDDVGTWLFHCHVGDHITAGMLATYTVRRSI